MQVPAVSRCRNLIAGVVSYLPLKLYKKSNGEELGNPLWIDQPDYRQPRSVTISWTVDSLLFYGYGYLQITELFADTMRVRSAQRIVPTRVGVFLNSNGTEVLYYTIDGKQIPDSGVGSMVVFYGNDEGLLNRAGRTIRTGAELERAAANYAREPIPSMVLKSNGTALPADRIAKLLEAVLTKFAKFVIQQARTNLTKGRHNFDKTLYNSLQYKLFVGENSFTLGIVTLFCNGY